MKETEGQEATQIAQTAQTAPAIDKLAKALVKFQGEVSNPTKNQTVNTGKYSYSYADLGHILDHVRPAMAKSGLAIVQRIQTTNEKVSLVTDLIHESGQMMTSTHPLPSGCGAQEFGSFLTYARRYSVASILLLAAEDDDDAAKAAGVSGGAGGNDATLRDQLEEAMCNDSVSNIGLVRWCQSKGMVGEKARITDDLPRDVVQVLLDRWDDVVAEVRKQTKAKAKAIPNSTPVKEIEPEKTKPGKKADQQKKQASKKQHEPAEKKPEKQEDDAGDSPWDGSDGLPPQLLKLMKRDNIPPALLKAVYVEAGHFPDTVDPADLPEDYVQQICEHDTWSKLAAKAASIEVPF